MKALTNDFSLWRSLLFALSLLCLTTNSFSQDTYADTLNCEGGTPTYVVDLSEDSDSLWISDPTERAGSCCATDDNCVQFSLTLAADATGIIFYVPDGCGATPTGSLFYQVDCGPLTNVGEPICLDGPGPFTITFCKPGNNENCYSIKSITEPQASEGITITDGCIDSLWIQGLEEETITWTSVFPGEDGEYDDLLSCITGCDTTIVEGTPGEIYPDLIKYEVCGTSFGGCAGTPHCDTLPVTIVPSLSVEITPLEPTICFGEAGIDLTATPEGGALPYTYTWNTGETTASIFATGPGTYFVEIGDGTGCAIAYDTVVVTEYILPITADAGPDISICSTPFPSVNLDGAITGSTTAIWSGGEGTFDVDDTDLDAIYTPTATEVAAGFIELILTTTDNGTCPGAEDTVVISFPSFTSVIDSYVENVDCFGNDNGHIDLTPSGGALPLIFDWSNGTTTEDVTGLAPDNYIVTLTDTNGCMEELTFTIMEPTMIEMTALFGSPSCSGFDDGYIDWTIIGGTGTYTFEWDTGETTEDRIGITAGDFTLTVSDENGCTLDSTLTITEPTAITIANAITTVSCNSFSDGAIDISATGGIPTYTFEWDTGEITEDLTDIPAGTYEITVTDANGCTEILAITVEEPTALLLTGVPSDALCFGETTGSVDISIEGGTPGYLVMWDGGEISEDITGIGAGTYGVTIADANGCEVSEEFIVAEPAPISIDATTVNVACFGEATGVIDITTLGGVGSYTYDWSTGEDTEDINDLTAGTYTVTVTDENECVLTSSISITNPPALLLDMTGTDVTCPGLEDGAVDVTVSGGVEPYYYAWDIGGVGGVIEDEDLVDIGAGTYTLEVTDDNGCGLEDSISISEPVDFEAGPDSTFAICTNEGFVNLSDFLFATTTGNWSELTASGQFNPVTGQLNTNGLPAGDYVFNYIIPQFTPCTDTMAEFFVTIHPLPDVNFTADEIAGCAPLPINFTKIFDEIDGSCKWYFGDGTTSEECGPVSHSYDYPGNYDVRLEVTSSDGCFNFFEAESFIQIYDKPSASFYYSPDDPDVQHTLIEFDNNSFGASSYIWNFGDGSPESDLENPIHNFPDAPNATYPVSLIAINDYGCTDTAYQKITIDDVLIFYVPNVFTPDGDTYNEDFRPVMTSGFDIYDYHLTVFNRWGEIVFESRNVDTGWNGTYRNGDLVQDGVYVWSLDFAESMSDKRHKEVGHVTVLR